MLFLVRIREREREREVAWRGVVRTCSSSSSISETANYELIKRENLPLKSKRRANDIIFIYSPT